MISDALAKGIIDSTRASSLRAEVDRIAALEATAKREDGSLSYYDALRIASALNALTETVVPLSNVTVATPLIGERIVTVNEQLVFVDKIEFELRKMNTRVDDEFQDGRLSSRQVAQLKTRLNEIAALESKYKKGGDYSENKERTLAIKLESVKTQLEKDIAYINEKRSQIGIRVD